MQVRLVKQGPRGGPRGVIPPRPLRLPERRAPDPDRDR